jgi:hypothetical protein
VFHSGRMFTKQAEVAGHHTQAMYVQHTSGMALPAYQGCQQQHSTCCRCLREPCCTDAIARTHSKHTHAAGAAAPWLCTVRSRFGALCSRCVPLGRNLYASTLQLGCF